MNIWEDGENMKEIAKGIKRHLVDGETELSSKRMSICLKCDDREESLAGDRCKLCGCILKFKTKSDSSCPAGKW
jgi:hypothetical protein